MIKNLVRFNGISIQFYEVIFGEDGEQEKVNVYELPIKRRVAVNIAEFPFIPKAAKYIDSARKITHDKPTPVDPELIVEITPHLTKEELETILRTYQFESSVLLRIMEQTGWSL